MSWKGWVRSCALGCMVLTGAMTAPAPATAALKPIRGELSRPGHVVLAMAGSGKTKTVRAKRGSFSLRPPAADVTLHLRGPSGVYAGPVVIDRVRQGKRAILGVKAGARLGTIVVRPRKGYAKVRRDLPTKSIERAFWARAKKGVPIGAKRFGRVRSRLPRPSVAGDLDLDGLPDLLDIDDDGDLILDKFDRSKTARASVITDQFLFHVNLALGLSNTANANAAGLTEQQMDVALSDQGLLMMGIIPGDSQELDCGQPQSRSDPRAGGLVYCSTGGTGRLFTPAQTGELPRFPDAFDPDGDGFGAMTPVSDEPAPGSGQLAMFLRHGATTAQIGTGDLLIQRVMRNGLESQYPGTIQYVFATVPALVSYSDGRGNSATVDYPVQGPNPGPPGPGTHENGFPVKASATGDVVVTLTFWRPQRRAIEGEAGDWTDIGRLNYSAGRGGSFCPQTAFSTKDSNLRPLTTADVFPASYFGFRDRAVDQPADPGNTFTYTLNLSKCLAEEGVSFEPGETQSFTFNAIAPNGTDAAEQFIAFKRE